MPHPVILSRVGLGDLLGFCARDQKVGLSPSRRVINRKPKTTHINAKISYKTSTLLRKEGRMGAPTFVFGTAKIEESRRKSRTK